MPETPIFDNRDQLAEIGTRRLNIGAYGERLNEPAQVRPGIIVPRVSLRSDQDHRLEVMLNIVLHLN
jgi:hypothetical protein